MRCCPVLRKHVIPSMKGKSLDAQIRSVTPKKGKRLFREAVNEHRDHTWISSNTISITKSKFVQSQFKSFSDVKSNDCLYKTKKDYQTLVDVVQFQLSGNISRMTLQYKDTSGQWQSSMFASSRITSVKSFEHKVVTQLNNFKAPQDIQILNLLVPTTKSLPNTLYNLLNPSPSSAKLIENFFASKPELKSIEDRAYYLYETAYQVELKITQDQHVPVQELKVDITNPAEWYSSARTIKRKLILHVGPTNSGKTYNALNRLKETNNGFFAGPLRLLAREVYDRFKSEKIPCNLITGEEIINDLDEFGNRAPLSCGTIEMIDLKSYFDVVILDEIQMIGDFNRGWAWTNALLGARAKEVHLCGEASVVDLIKELAKMTGDEVIVNEYKRLGRLQVENRPLDNGISDLKKGDCIVAFSKKQILNTKADIEASSDFKCSVIYGALPAETRSAEANKFNSGKSDILIASDAIGMGLNLKIDRIIFSTHKKFDGKKNTQLEPPQVKQIAGRAGRFKVAPVQGSEVIPESNDVTEKGPSVGYVSAFDERTLAYVRKSLSSKTKMLKKAYLWPSDEIWCNYMSEFPSTNSFESIIRAFEIEVKSSRHLIIAPAEDRLRLVKIFEKFKELLIGDRLRMSVAPINTRMPGSTEALQEFSMTVANSHSKIPIHFKSLDFEPVLKKKATGVRTVDAALLGNLEALHKLLLVWLWMNNRYPTLFVDRESANDLKNLIEDRIETILETSEPIKSKFYEKRSKYMMDIH